MSALSSLTHAKVIQPLSPDEILGLVAAEFGCTPAAIRVGTKKRSISFSRHVTVYLIKTYFPSLTWEEIGQIFGGRDHTTMINSYRCIIQALEEDEAFKARMGRLLARIGPLPSANVCKKSVLKKPAIKVEPVFKSSNLTLIVDKVARTFNLSLREVIFSRDVLIRQTLIHLIRRHAPEIPFAELAEEVFLSEEDGPKLLLDERIIRFPVNSEELRFHVDAISRAIREQKYPAFSLLGPEAAPFRFEAQLGQNHALVVDACAEAGGRAKIFKDAEIQDKLENLIKPHAASITVLRLGHSALSEAQVRLLTGFLSDHAPNLCRLNFEHARLTAQTREIWGNFICASPNLLSIPHLGLEEIEEQHLARNRQAAKAHVRSILKQSEQGRSLKITSEIAKRAGAIAFRLERRGGLPGQRLALLSAFKAARLNDRAR